MVSVEIKSEYINNIRDNEEISGFVELLFRGTVSSQASQNFNDARVVSSETSAAIYNDDSERFLIAYRAFSARNPTAQSPWIYNDFLIFLLVCGVTKFNGERKWLLNVLELRSSTNSEQKELKQTMILLLNSEGGKHEYSLRPVEFVYRELVGIEKPNEEELTSTYKSLSQKSFPYYESDFLNLICLKAIDLVVEWKGINNHEKTQELNAFVARFEDRTSVISKTIVSILLLILLGGLCYLGYLAYNKPNDKILTLIISLMGLAGISGAALIGKWKQAHRWTTRQVRSFFGYMSK